MLLSFLQHARPASAHSSAGLQLHQPPLSAPRLVRDSFCVFFSCTRVLLRRDTIDARALKISVSSVTHSHQITTNKSLFSGPNYERMQVHVRSRQ